MPLHLQGIEWMPSPPLVPDDGPLDLEHLRRMTFGDAGLEREVLALFVGQATRLVGALGTLSPDAGRLAHTLKGADPAPGLAELRDAVAEAQRAIRIILGSP
jgi:hypothetical protein